MRLIDKDGNEVKEGAALTTFRGEPCKLLGGQPPHKPSSTGLIYVEIDGEANGFYPSVCGLKWVD